MMRHPLLRGLYPGNLGTDFTIPFDILALTMFAIVMLALASLLFGEEEHLGRILLVETPRAKGAKAEPAKRLFGLRRARPELKPSPPAPTGGVSPAD